MISKTVIFSLLVLAVAGIYGLTVIPESVRVLEQNDKYLKWAKMNIRRYQRRGDYVINISGHTLHTWGNNVTINIVLTEYLHNEYRPSFIQNHFQLCDFINNEPYIGGMVKKKIIKCPIPAGEVNMLNMTVLSQNFPNVFPFAKGGANVDIKITDTDEMIIKVEFHAKFIQKKKP